MFPRWLPLYLLALAALTLYPFSAPGCPSPGWLIALVPSDGLANLLVFVPIGIALRHSSLARALLLSLALSFAIEIAQEWLPRRQDITDLVANSAGAGVGHWLAHTWTARWPGPLLRTVTWRLALRLCAPLLLSAALVAALLNPINDFSNWEPFPIVLGNEATGDRPWIGDLAEFAVFDRPLAPNEVAETLSGVGTPRPWRDGGPILWLRFGPHPQGRLDGPDGPRPYVPPVLARPEAFENPQHAAVAALSLHPSGVRLSPAVADHLLERLRATNQITLDIRFRPASLSIRGPARIVSFGGSPFTRNFMLGQQRDRLIVRIRTPGTGRNGSRPQPETPPGSLTGEQQHARIVFDGYETLIWLDGVCETESKVATATAMPLLDTALGTTIVLCTALCALAAASSARDRRGRWLRGLAGGAGAWAALWLFGAWDHLPAFDDTAAMLGALALLTSAPLLHEPPEVLSRPDPPG